METIIISSLLHTFGFHFPWRYFFRSRLDTCLKHGNSHTILVIWKRFNTYRKNTQIKTYQDFQVLSMCRSLECWSNAERLWLHGGALVRAVWWHLYKNVDLREQHLLMFVWGVGLTCRRDLLQLIGGSISLLRSKVWRCVVCRPIYRRSGGRVTLFLRRWRFRTTARKRTRFLMYFRYLGVFWGGNILTRVRSRFIWFYTCFRCFGFSIYVKI